MHEKRGDLNRDRRVARSGGWLDRVASTLGPSGPMGDASALLDLALFCKQRSSTCIL